jgi:hypothetical protein
MGRFPGRDPKLAAIVRKSYEDQLSRDREALPRAAPERLIYGSAAVANDLREVAFLAYADGDPLPAGDPCFPIGLIT